MISVMVEVGQSDELRYVRANGHANAGSKGNDIVCSAVSVLLRTVVLTLFDEKAGLKTRLDVQNCGALEFEVEDYNLECIGLLRYAAEFLQKGMESIQQEKPESIELVLNRVYA
ncbi:MAG: ribosomal-processing cysteine protease Prp [Treponema sp.]|nr:MAG: ribosomal-processing cysteine protease Prp [Treponema sp.]